MRSKDIFDVINTEITSGGFQPIFNMSDISCATVMFSC